MNIPNEERLAYLIRRSQEMDKEATEAIQSADDITAQDIKELL